MSLVLKEEIDLLEVPLFEVISAYLEEMEAAGVAGYWDEMTEFLLLMSLLVEVKSRLLLPEAPVELEEMTRAGPGPLLARLFEYSKLSTSCACELARRAQAVLFAGLRERRSGIAAAREIVGTGDVGSAESLNPAAEGES